MKDEGLGGLANRIRQELTELEQVMQEKPRLRPAVISESVGKRLNEL